MVNALGVEVSFGVETQQLVFRLPCEKIDKWTATISAVHSRRPWLRRSRADVPR